MTLDVAIKKIENSNLGINMILENIEEQFQEIRSDPKLEGLTDDLENLFHAYLKTWKATNTEILELIKEEKIKHLKN